MMYSIIFVYLVQDQMLNLIPMLLPQYFIMVDIALNIIEKSDSKKYDVLPAILTYFKEQHEVESPW